MDKFVWVVILLYFQDIIDIQVFKEEPGQAKIKQMKDLVFKKFNNQYARESWEACLTVKIKKVELI